MDAPELDWASAIVDTNSDPVLTTVPWQGSPPASEFLDSLYDVVQLHESETRGQQWDGIELLSTEAVTVVGLESDGLPVAKVYLSGCIQAAADRSERDQQAQATADARAAQKREAALKDADELRRRLRES